MLDKNIDITLVGHNFFSYLMGIGLLAKNKKVLILDDDRFNYGELFTDSITILDLEILKKWGEKYDVPPLKKMEEYIQFSPVSFYVGKKEILLGDNPSRNYTELARKFSAFFESTSLDENFDQGVYQIAHSLAEAFYVDQDLIKLPNRLAIFKQLSVMKKFEEFILLFSKKADWDFMQRSEWNSFIFLTRGYFHNRLSISGSRSELLHLFLSLLSPRFKFDHKSLVEDLLNHFKSIGGEFKKLNISSMKFQKSLVSTLELESYEGLISPQHVLFIGGELNGLPIMLKEKVPVFNAMKVNLEFTVPSPQYLVGKKILFSSPMKTGTNWPMWEGTFLENGMIFNIVMLKRQGIKVEFVSEKVLSYLKDDLDFLYPEFNFQIKTSSFQFTLDVLIEDLKEHSHLVFSPKLNFKPIKVYSKVTPFSFLKLKNISYLGPYGGNTHGVFSGLIQLQKLMEAL